MFELLYKTKRHYKKTMIPPAIYIALMIVVILVTSLQPYGKAENVTDYESLQAQLKQGNEVAFTVENACYLGYSEELLGKTMAYYYIGEFDDTHVIFTVSEAEYEEIGPAAERYELQATIRIHTGRLGRVELAVIDQMGWTQEGMKDQVVQVLFEDLEVMRMIAVVVFWFVLATIALAIFGMVIQWRYLKNPENSPYYKKHKKEY
ncbi:MAG: hypothetical protein K6G01_08300 [Eubacterium sp.]|nr:hypothetical protein [Eubacterium sp.]